MEKRVRYIARLLAIRDGIIPPDKISTIPHIPYSSLLTNQSNPRLIKRRFRKIKRIANKNNISVADHYIRLSLLILNNPSKHTKFLK